MKRRKFSIISIIFALLALCEISNAHYSPELGNFLNRDPIEEQGGVNLYAFAERDPINKFDDLGLRPKLTAVESQPFEPGNCGAFSWKIRWSVDTPSSQMFGGQILQDIEVRTEIQNCDGSNKLGFPKVTKFSELWRVMPGTTDINSAAHLNLPRFSIDEDTFQGPDRGVCTEGKMTVVGFARYYSAQLTPDNWGTGNGIGTVTPPLAPNIPNGLPSGYAPSHRDNPNWSKGSASSKLVKHSIVVKWNCCPGPVAKATEKIYSTIE